MNEVVTAALLFTAVGLLFVGLGVPLLSGRVRHHAELALLFVLALSIIIMAVDSHGAQKRM